MKTGVGDPITKSIKEYRSNTEIFVNLVDTPGLEPDSQQLETLKNDLRVYVEKRRKRASETDDLTKDIHLVWCVFLCVLFYFTQHLFTAYRLL